MSFSYAAEKVFADMANLQHGNDGLIYTCINVPYGPANMSVNNLDTTVLYIYALSNSLKWKPPSENSIDFKLVLRFPPLQDKPSQPDFHTKPVFLLYVWCGADKYEKYDTMYVEDEEWEK